MFTIMCEIHIPRPACTGAQSDQSMRHSYMYRRVDHKLRVALSEDCAGAKESQNMRSSHMLEEIFSRCIIFIIINEQKYNNTDM